MLRVFHLNVRGLSLDCSRAVVTWGTCPRSVASALKLRSVVQGLSLHYADFSRVLSVDQAHVPSVMASNTCSNRVRIAAAISLSKRRTGSTSRLSSLRSKKKRGEGEYSYAAVTDAKRVARCLDA